jgi:hypothetical protein
LLRGEGILEIGFSTALNTAGIENWLETYDEPGVLSIQKIYLLALMVAKIANCPFHLCLKSSGFECYRSFITFTRVNPETRSTKGFLPKCYKRRKVLKN